MAAARAWHTLSVSADPCGAAVAAEAVAPAGSPWFDGHFPGRPVLPGIALIAMACDAARQLEARRGGRIRLKSLGRVRFKKPVLPDEQCTIELLRELRPEGIAYRFTVKVGGETGCTGILHAEPLAAENRDTTIAG